MCDRSLSSTQLDSLLLSISIYIQQCVTHFCRVVPPSTSRFGTHLTVAHALLQRQSFQGADALLKSCCVPYGKCWCILTRYGWYLRMRLCSNEIIQLRAIKFVLSCFACLFVLVFPNRRFIFAFSRSLLS